MHAPGPREAQCSKQVPVSITLVVGTQTSPVAQVSWRKAGGSCRHERFPETKSHFLGSARVPCREGAAFREPHRRLRRLVGSAIRRCPVARAGALPRDRVVARSAHHLRAGHGCAISRGERAGVRVAEREALRQTPTLGLEESDTSSDRLTWRPHPGVESGASGRKGGRRPICIPRVRKRTPPGRWRGPSSRNRCRTHRSRTHRLWPYRPGLRPHRRRWFPGRGEYTCKGYRHPYLRRRRSSPWCHRSPSYRQRPRRSLHPCRRRRRYRHREGKKKS